MTYRDFWRELTGTYDEREAREIGLLVYEERFGLSRTDICMGEDSRMSEKQDLEAKEILARLMRNEPVQYVLGSVFFGQSRYKVKPGVLIPRPETAALVEWMTDDLNADEMWQKARKEPMRSTDDTATRLLDCCCGSGCIGLEMKGTFPELQVEAYDIADEAIEVSRDNAKQLGRDIKIFRMDALHPTPSTHKYDIIVSNPPYVCDHEKAEMHRNVLDYEPHKALFVPDDDPIKFYTAIAQYATEALKDNGRIYFEINPLCKNEMTEMLVRLGFSDICVNDSCGYADRLMKARLHRNIIPPSNEHHS